MGQAPLGVANSHNCTDLNVGTKPSLYLLGRLSMAWWFGGLHVDRGEYEA